MVNKKAQMKIQQTAFMLIAIVMFFVLAGIFVISFKLSSLKKDAALLEERNALFLVTKLAESPEFSCGQGFGNKKVHCIDFDKILALKNNINKYKDFWQVSNIEIIRIQALGQEIQEIECTPMNYPNCTYLKLISQDSSGPDYSTFVSLCRKGSYQGEIYDQCDLAKFILRYGENNEE